MTLRCNMPTSVGLLLACSSLASAANILKDDSSKPRHFQQRQLSSDLQFTCTTDSLDCYSVGDNNFQLTEDETFNSRSAIWANQLVNLEGSFTMEAEIMIDSPTFVGGEGLALVFQTEGNEALGAAGNGKGYEGISSCVAIDIDTHTETDSGSISIVKNSPTKIYSQIGSANIGYIKDLRIRALRVEYDAATKQIQVAFDGEQVLAGTLDLASELGSNKATWGFTASSAETLSSSQWVYFTGFDNEWASEAPSQSPSLGATSSPTALYLHETFDTGSNLWAFKPNLFGTSGDVAHVSGEASATKFGQWYHGVSSGGLRLHLTSGAGENVSGGWETTVVVPEDIQSASLDFHYRAYFDDGFEPSESAQVLAEVGEVQRVIETIQGSYGASSYVSLWGDAKLEFGALVAGTYKIKIGGLLAASASHHQVFQMRIDNVSFSGVPQG